nr:MAG: ORF1 [Torque teno midi virus]
MPFWWRRRRKWWWGKRRYYRKRYPTRRQKRRRRRYKRKYRRASGRRRGRRKKVRKKLKKLTVKIWQPQTIKKCTIKGYTINCMGGHGRQYICYTDNKYRWTPRLAPGGGGIGVEKYSLQYLYSEYQRGNNIWSTSNKYLDLVRYTGCQFKFYRHQHLDFVVYYSRDYPMLLEKYTYSFTHPYSLIKRKHHRIIPSMLTKPHGKNYVIIKMKPPRQLSTRWFFQENFKDTGLVQIHTAVCDLRYSHLGCCNANQLVTFRHLNLDMYTLAGWGNSHPPGTTVTAKWYRPNAREPQINKVKIGDRTVTVNWPTTTSTTKWEDTICRKTGWFQSALMLATEVVEPPQQILPTRISRYNPTTDTGIGNKVYFVNVVNYSFDPPETDKLLIAQDLPIWQVLLGFPDFIRKTKGDTTFLISYYLVIQSKSIEPGGSPNQKYIVIDDNFANNRAPYGGDVTSYMETHWYPSYPYQQETINAFVTCGPYMPKLDNQKQSTWELKSSYKFYFKWGGAELPEPEVTNPKDQATYDVPTNLSQAVQIADPSKQSASKTLHLWDFRRGLITPKALKRICQDSESDESIYSDTEQPPQKKKKIPEGNSLPCVHKETQEIQECLLSLYEEPTWQEAQEGNLQQLIKQQQQQQQQIKQQLLKLITNLQKRQSVLQLHTGILD